MKNKKKPSHAQNIIGNTSFLYILTALTIILVLGYIEEITSDPNFFGPMKLTWLLLNKTIQPKTAEIGAGLLFSLFMVSRRPKLSIILTIIFFGLISIGIVSKIHYLGTPLTIADITFFFSDIKENFVIFFYYPTLGLLVFSSTILTISLIIRALQIERKFEIKLIGKSAIISIILVSTYGMDNIAIAKNNYFNLDANEASMAAGRAYGHNLKQEIDLQSTSIFELIEVFFTKKTTNFDVPHKTTGHSFKKSDLPPETGEIIRPDVVAILNESLFNPQILQACDANPTLCDFEAFKNNSPFPGVHGPLFVHTHGGGTWLSEFAFLTGFDWRAFGEGGAYAPRSIVPHLQFSLVTHFKKLGYRTIAIYPVAGNFLNAREAYKKYGFDEFYATEDLGIKTDWQTTSDGTIFKKALEISENSADKRPIFMFILTIKNHGPHAKNISDIKNTNDEFLAKSSDLPSELVDYLNRMHETDESISSFRKAWLKSENPRTFVWFGDHQPQFTRALKRSDNFSLGKFETKQSHLKWQLVTWYELTSNSPDRQISHQIMPRDLAFLGTEVIKYSGLPLPGHGKATLQMSEQCPLGLSFCENENIVDDYLSFRIWDLEEIKLTH